MAVPANPKMSQVYAEFGAPTGTHLSAFLRGGSWVPNGPTANNGVPTVLPLKLSQLAGSLKATLTASVSPSSLSASRTTPGVAVTAGSATATPGGSTVGPFTYAWHTHTNSGNAITATSPSSSSSTFSATVNGSVPNTSGYAYCTITDTGSGLTADTAHVSLGFAYLS